MSLCLIRQGTNKDGHDLLSVHLDAICGLGPAAYTAEECESWASGLKAEGYSEAMSHGGEVFLVAETRGIVVGFCSYKDNELRMVETPCEKGKIYFLSNFRE